LPTSKADEGEELQLNSGIISVLLGELLASRPGHFPHTKKSSRPNEWEDGWFPELVCSFRKRDKAFIPAGKQSFIPQFSYPILVTTLTGITRILKLPFYFTGKLFRTF
jgi:hypothetical protein